jgi:hypothetical protein
MRPTGHTFSLLQRTSSHIIRYAFIGSTRERVVQRRISWNRTHDKHTYVPVPGILAYSMGMTSTRCTNLRVSSAFAGGPTDGLSTQITTARELHQQQRKEANQSVLLRR